MVGPTSQWQWELYPPWEDDGPVASFIEDQDVKQQARIVRKFELLKTHGAHLFLLGKDHVERFRTIRKPAVYELKVKGHLCSYRFLFVCVQSTIVFLHGVQKKGQGLRKKDIQTAQHRANEVLDYYERREP